MAKVFLWIVAGIITLVIVGAIVVSQFGEEIFVWSVTPPHSLAEETMPPAPDYVDDASWAALPGKADPVDTTPPGAELSDQQNSAGIDVFFIHPTTHISRSSWIAAIDGPDEAMEFLNGFVLPSQASVFNGCCRVFAPHYRQATVAAFFENAQPDGLKALDFAYKDVRQAWKNFIDNRNQGRPFILASHSQGSLHAIRLLLDEIAGSRTAERMIAAYVIGYPVPMSLFDSRLGELWPCASEDETGCVLSWQSFSEGGNADDVVDFAGLGIPGIEVGATALPMLCTNPLTGTASRERRSAAFHAGGVDLAGDSEGLGEVRTGFASARCDEDGVLWVGLDDEDGFRRFRTPTGNLHAYDYNLFYMDMRQDLHRRVNAFLNTWQLPDKEQETTGKAGQ